MKPAYMVEIFGGGLKECHSLIQRGAEKVAADVFEQEVVPMLRRLIGIQEELPKELQDELRALKYGSYMDLTGFLSGKGIRKRGQ